MTRPKWRWFIARLVVGASYAGVLAAAFAGGLLLLPVTVGGTVIFTRGGRDQGMPGLFSGLGVGPLAVAYVNRDGPGDVCTRTAGGDACVQDFNPLPWLIIGIVLFTAGLIWFARRRRTTT